VLPNDCKTGPARLWVDVSTLLRWRGKITGIPRTVCQLVEHLPNTRGLRMRLCAFNGGLRTYEEVRPRPAWAEVRPAPPHAKRYDRLRRLYRLLPPDLQQAGRDGFSALRCLTRFLVRSGQESLAPLGRGLRNGAARLSRRGDPSPFGDGDVLVLPGATWDDIGCHDALDRIRRTRRLSVVSVVYDVIAAVMPQVCDPRLPPLFEPWLRRLLFQSDLVLTISDRSRRDLIALARRWGVAAPPVGVMRLGDAPPGGNRPARPRGLPAGVRSFVLTVATFEPRKNHWLLYQMWRRLVEQFGSRVPALVLAGHVGWATRDLLKQVGADPLVRGRVLPLLDATDEELSWLYANCLFTLYPSFYEGWGLPVAESLANGKYCICSNAASLPEVGGGLVDYHDPLDALRCIELVRRALFKPGFLEAREARIREEYRPISWAECAARVVPLLERNLGVRLVGPDPATKPT